MTTSASQRQVLGASMDGVSRAGQSKVVHQSWFLPSVLCCAHLVSFWNEQSVSDGCGSFVNRQMVGRRFEPPFEKLRGDVKLIWHPLLFGFFRAMDVPALVTPSCECGATTYKTEGGVEFAGILSRLPGMTVGSPHSYAGPSSRLVPLVQVECRCRLACLRKARKAVLDGCVVDSDFFW